MVFRTFDDGEWSGHALREAFASAIAGSLAELEHGCERLDAEIADATAAQRFTFVALDGVELSLSRVQRRHRTLVARDVLGLVETQHATSRVRESEARFAELRGRVRAVNDVAP